jgi:hypothetical protein
VLGPTILEPLVKMLRKYQAQKSVVSFIEKTLGSKLLAQIIQLKTEEKFDS